MLKAVVPVFSQGHAECSATDEFGDIFSDAVGVPGVEKYLRTLGQLEKPSSENECPESVDGLVIFPENPDEPEENPELERPVGESHFAEADFQKFHGGYAVLLPDSFFPLLCVGVQ